MSLYVFEAKDGSQIELDFPMRVAPTIGTPVRRNGKTYRRIPSPCQRPIVTTPITSYTLPSRTYMDPRMREHVTRWDENDAPQFDTKAEAKRYAEAERRLCEKGELSTFHSFGDAPSTAEVRAAQAQGKRIKGDG